MSVKEFIQLFIPPVFYKVKGILCHKQTPKVESLPMRERKGDKLIVIGNGPSLNKTMELYGDVVCRSECVMVNFSANTSLFEKIRPSIYMLVDPAWFNPQNHAIESINACIESIVKKTAWSMTIVMPHRAKGSIVIEPFCTNPNIKVLFYEDGWKLPKGMSQFEAWDKNLVCPPGQTVLNTAVWLSVYWGYSETYLIGADTTWMENSRMDQTNNKLYEYDTHFYASQEVYGDMKTRQKNDLHYLNVTYSQSLMEMYNVIHGYEELEEYAKWKGVKVFNASEYSWIDAFERKKLDTIA